MKRVPVILPAPASQKEIAITMSQDGLQDLSDTELVQLCQERGARDDRPFQELLRRYQSAIWRVCYSFTGNPQDAEDLTQEVFFKAYRSLATFEGRSSFKSWLYRVAINSSKNEIRRRKSRPQVSETDVETLAEVLPSATSVETEWQARHRREQLAQAIAQLQPEASEILLMKDVEQRPYAEIAEMLGIGISAAKMRAQRARLALQVAYRQLDGMEAS